MSLILPLEKQALNLRPLLWLLLPLLVLATLFFWPLSLIVEQALRGANGEIGLETFRQ
ncbi:2-aminoethylphosphonate ABC transporter permease, partial [Salmonella enterica subsp. enterica serovar Infantis]|nr:2-aminoethylphosphonate ABC transporter permease [Salmonella enterica subsp. enterica serovar Infantis]